MTTREAGDLLDSRVCPYTRLWLEVLINAIIDYRAAIEPWATKSKDGCRGMTVNERHYAKRWPDLRDFALVCAKAGVEPEWLRPKLDTLDVSQLHLHSLVKRDRMRVAQEAAAA